MKEIYWYDEVLLASDTILTMEIVTYWDIPEILKFRMWLSTDIHLIISGKYLQYFTRLTLWILKGEREASEVVEK
jgi:hypothetical protein